VSVAGARARRCAEFPYPLYITFFQKSTPHNMNEKNIIKNAEDDIKRILSGPPRTDNEITKSAFNRVIEFIEHEQDLTRVEKNDIIDAVRKYQNLT